MKKTIILFLLLFPIRIQSQVKPPVPLPERQRTYDVKHIKIKVSFDWNEKKVIGNVETVITPLSDGLSDFEVDAIGFKINYVRDKNGNDINYNYDGKKILVKLDNEYSIADTMIYTIDYTCKPQLGLYFIYPSELNPSMPYQIWTQGEAEENRHWLPIYDYPNDKTTFEIFVVIDNKFKTLSNGYLDYSKKISDTEREDHWIMDKPNSTYLIMLAAGNYNIVEDRFENLPVQSYTDTNINFEDSKFTFRNTPAMVELFSQRYQKDYPWKKYAQIVVEDFIHGGMENTSATVLNKRCIINHDIEPNYSPDDLISHELGHQWWGDLITCRNWNELWLNEAFATYSASLWKEKYSGKDEYDYDILKNGDNAIRVESFFGRYPVWAGYGSVTTNIYDKGAVMINTFRHILGEKFFDALGTFLNDNEYKCVQTDDLLNAVNKTCGGEISEYKDYEWMFEQWIRKAGYPILKVNYKYDKKSKKVSLSVNQIQKFDTLTPVFRLPVDVRIKNSKEDKIVRIDIRDSAVTYNMDCDSKPEFVVFDCGNNILDKLYFDKPFEDWKNQFLQSENAIDRITALRGMEIFLKDDTSQTAGKSIITINQIAALKLMEDALNSDKFWGTRVEAAEILGKNFILEKSSQVLKNSYNLQSNPKIKRAILKALGNSKRAEDIEFIKIKIQNEPNDYLVAEGITALRKGMNKEEIYDVVIPFGNRKAHREVVQTAVINALDSSDNRSRDERVKKYLIDIAFGTDVDGRLRANAIGALTQYASDEDVKSLAKKYCDYNFTVVKFALIRMLAASKDKELIPFLNELKETATDEQFVKLLSDSIKKLENS